MTVTVYGRPSCAPCQTLKTFLNKKGIQFTNRNVDEDKEAQAEAFAYTGLNIVPVTVVDDGKEKRVISGFNLSQLIPAIQ